MSTSTPTRLYVSTIPSGNCHKVQYLAAHLGLDLEIVALDIMATPSQTRTPAFLQKNPNGRIPVLELADGRCLAESNAILLYLARGTAYLPDDSWLAAKVHQWLFFEQYSHEPYIAVLKFWTYFGGLDKCSPADLERWRTRGEQALDVMHTRLRDHDFLVDSGYSVADMALFAYTQTAEDLEFSLVSRPGITRWLDRVRAQPGFPVIAAVPSRPGHA